MLPAGPVCRGDPSRPALSGSPRLPPPLPPRSRGAPPVEPAALPPAAPPARDERAEGQTARCGAPSAWHTQDGGLGGAPLDRPLVDFSDGVGAGPVEEGATGLRLRRGGAG